MTPGEMIVLIILILAGMYLASKVLGLIWEVIGGPVSRVFWYFFEWRYPEDEEEPVYYASASVKCLTGGQPRPQLEIMSSSVQTGQTDKTDRQTDRASEAEQWIARLKVDRTKATLIELLVYSEWGVGEIRATLKGDSGAIGEAVRAVRGEGDKGTTSADPDVHVTPIAGRVTKREYYPDEPELEYRTP